jgi:hypothetical protein
MVPTVVRRGTDGDMMGVMISENEIRRGDPPLVKARKVQKLLDYGFTEEQIANRFGVSIRSVQNWVTLLDCDNKVIKAVEANKISASAAIKLAALPREQQRETLVDMIASGGTTTEHAAANTRARQGKTKPTTSPTTPSDGDAGEAVEVIVAPGKRLLKKVIDQAGGGDLDPLVIKTLKWVTGQTKPQGIKGLTKILHGIEAEAEAKRAARRDSKNKRQAPPRSGA